MSGLIRIDPLPVWSMVRSGLRRACAPPRRPAAATAEARPAPLGCTGCPLQGRPTAALALPRARFLGRVAGVAGAAAVGMGTDLLPQLLAPLSAAAAPSPVRSGATGPGLLLGSVRTLPRNQALTYTDPASGDPALLLHLADGRFVAYDAVCTHAGCTVTYDPVQRRLVCPCHGAVYDPARGAAVLAGPAPSPLAALAIRVN